MQQNKSSFYRTAFYGFAVACILVAGFATRALMAQQQGQKMFASPEDASKALVAALQNKDTTAMVQILGPDAHQIMTTGDDTQDAQDRANFVKGYQEMHRLMKEPDGTMTLYTGAENWPMPIPLVRKGNSWFFDTAAGEKEILYRRIGRNEISTIDVCKELVAAEKEYYSAHHNEYAQRIFSGDGQHDGLYWKTSAGEPRSPIGPLVAAAVDDGQARSGSANPAPYRGYYYHILTSQGKNAPGGAKPYIMNGKLTQGFAFIAYPAEYRSSGVMTFVVDNSGMVFRKDMGKDTTALAKAMKEYNPDSSWRSDEDQQEQTAAQQKTR